MGSAPSQPNKTGSVTVIRTNDKVALQLSPSRNKSADAAQRRPSINQGQGQLPEGAQPDVMISYSHNDTDQMNQLRDALTTQGFLVWVDVVGLQAGVNFFDKIGKAIISARLFITLLSESAIKSKYCRDEISLAYVLDKPIFPVHIEDREELEQCMDVGMRLEFASLNWYDYEKCDNSTLDCLFDSMTKAREDLLKAEKILKMARNPAKPLKRAQTRTLLRSKTTFMEPNEEDDFWVKNFKGKTTIEPQVFEEKLGAVIKDKIGIIKTDADKRYVLKLLRRKLVQKGAVTLQRYNDFCQDDNGRKMDFFERIEEFAVERYAINQVFKVDSSVRLQAIENLGRYRSAAVIDALAELLDDVDSDARAVSAVTLAKTGITNPVIIRSLIRLLRDEDRLVRESACLALGHLKVEEAVPDLVTIWRTEVMSTVRDAAEMALKKVGGDEASQALHMVGVLSKEIQFLINH